MVLMTGLLSLALVVGSLVLSAVVVIVFCNPSKPAGSGSVFLRSLEVSVIGFMFGFIARWMAKTDLHKMHVGRMNRSGRARTNGGCICGIIAMAVAIANIALTTILWLLIDTPGSNGVASWFR